MSIRDAQCTDYKWYAKYSEGQSELRLFVPRPSAMLLAIGLPRPVWVQLNRLCTGIGRFQLPMHKWGLAPTSICDCGALDQIAAHAILECPLHRSPRGYNGFLVLIDETKCWLKNIVANI